MASNRSCQIALCDCATFDPNPFAPAKCKCQHYEKDHRGTAPGTREATQKPTIPSNKEPSIPSSTAPIRSFLSPQKHISGGTSQTISSKTRNTALSPTSTSLWGRPQQHVPATSSSAITALITPRNRVGDNEKASESHGALKATKPNQSTSTNNPSRKTTADVGSRQDVLQPSQTQTEQATSAHNSLWKVGQKSEGGNSATRAEEKHTSSSLSPTSLTPISQTAMNSHGLFNHPQSTSHNVDMHEEKKAPSSAKAVVTETSQPKPIKPPKPAQNDYFLSKPMVSSSMGAKSSSKQSVSIPSSSSTTASVATSSIRKPDDEKAHQDIFKKSTLPTKDREITPPKSSLTENITQSKDQRKTGVTKGSEISSIPDHAKPVTTTNTKTQQNTSASRRDVSKTITSSTNVVIHHDYPAIKESPQEILLSSTLPTRFGGHSPHTGADLLATSEMSSLKITMGNPVRASVTNLPLEHLIPQGSGRESVQYKHPSVRQSVEGDVSISSIIKHGLKAAKLNDEHVGVIMSNINALKPPDSPLLDRHQLRQLLQILYKVQVIVGQQDLNRALVFLQSTFRMKIEQRKYQKLRSSAQYDRLRLVQNLYIDEKKYFSKLRSGFMVYYTELMVLASSNPQGRGQIPTVADIKALFGNFDVLYSFHQELLGALEAQLSGWPYAECRIGKIFRARAPFLKYYAEYVSNFHFASETMKRLESMERFKTVVAGAEEKHEAMSLLPILALPLNRVPQYESFLEAILQHTPKTHPDYNDLFEVLAIVRQTVPIIQDRLEHSAERAVILDILRRLQKSPSILSDKSKIILECEANEIKPKAGQRVMFLFTDRLITAKPQQRDYCKFRECIPTTQLKVKNIPDLPNARFLLEITGIETEVVSFPSAEEKDKWWKEFERIAREIAETRMFGASLEAVMRREPGSDVPHILKTSLEYLKKHAMNSVGIFRLSGDMAVVEELRRKWDEGDDINLEEYDVNVVAGSVKQWFRELPEPIFTYTLYDTLCSFGDVGQDSKARLAFAQDVIQKLPHQNLAVIKYLVEFLALVAAVSHENRMDAANLSTVFGPNLIKPREITIENAMDIPRVNQLICFIIENSKAIFK